MSTPRPEVATHDRFLAEANAELDAMLGEVGELDATPAPEPAPGRSWLQLAIIAVIAVAVFALGVMLLRGRRPRGMALHLMR